MNAEITLNLHIPRGDMAFVKKLGKRMGWTFTEVNSTDDALFDPESNSYLNEETMQAIRDVEAGKVMKCHNIDELLAAL